MGDLTKHFSRSEFACPCGCGADHIDLQLVSILEQIRETVDAPLRINSGVRCPAHNAAVGGKVGSAHVRGLAVDAGCSDSRLRHELVSLALRAGITRIGIAPGFVHLDRDPELSPRVLWMY